MSNLAFHPLAEIFPLLEGAEFKALVDDIAEHGLREPIKLYNGQIIDGRNRYRACLEADVEPSFEAFGDRAAYTLEHVSESDREYNDGADVVAQFYVSAEDGDGEDFDFSCPYLGDLADPVAFVVSLNLKRRHLSEGQRGMVAAKLANLSQGDNQHTGRANLPDHDDDQPGDSELFQVDDVDADSDPVPPVAPVSIAQAAGLLNVSERTVKSARAVQREGAPELVAAVERGEVSVSAAADVATLPKPKQAEIVARGEKEILQAAKDIRTRRVDDSREKRAAEKAAALALPAPTGKYRTIVIDPPWDMEKIVRDVRSNEVNFGFEYPTMTEEELSQFDVEGVADEDCHLFCWTTQKFLPSALRLVEAWGFKYVLCMVWHKTGGFQPYNLPQYNCEFVVYARKGSPEFVETKAFFTCFSGERREHSRKPDEFYDLARRVAPGPRIDIFSREPRSGFDQYGNEADKFAGAA